MKHTGLRPKDRFTAEITGYTSEGLGVARTEEGLAVFVPGAVAGEVAEIQVDHVGRSTAHGHIVRLEAVSPHRTQRQCPLGKRCGGCVFWHLDYAEEQRLKAQRVRDALTRIGGWDPGPVPILGAETCLGYRNKAQYPVAAGAKGPVAGFFQQRTHQVVPVDRCLIQPPQADTAKDAVLQWMRAWNVPAYNEQSHTGLVRHIFVRTASTGQTLCCIVANGRRLPQAGDLCARLRAAVPGLAGVVLSIHTRRGNTVLGDQFETLWGRDYVEETLSGLSFRLSARSFFQVNRAQAQRLYGLALELADLTPDDTALDLYCGTGTITLLLAQRAGRVYGVETVEAAVADAWENAARNGVDNVDFFCADAGEAAQRFAAEGIRPRVIVVDPPRKGLSGAVIEAMAAMAPDRIVYVSCDPATLARDVALLRDCGYRPQAARAVDLFPRCAHVETCVLLGRKESSKTEYFLSDEKHDETVVSLHREN